MGERDAGRGWYRSLLVASSWIFTLAIEGFSLLLGCLGDSSDKARCVSLNILVALWGCLCLEVALSMVFTGIFWDEVVVEVEYVCRSSRDLGVCEIRFSSLFLQGQLAGRVNARQALHRRLWRCPFLQPFYSNPC